MTTPNCDMNPVPAPIRRSRRRTPRPCSFAALAGTDAADFLAALSGGASTPSGEMSP